MIQFVVPNQFSQHFATIHDRHIQVQEDKIGRRNAGVLPLLVDQREAGLKEAGEIVQAIRRGAIQESDVREIGTLFLSGDAMVLSGDAMDFKKRTLFKSVGNAVQDLVVADFVLNQANRLGLGQLIEI